MARIIKIKKGLNIPLEGASSETITKDTGTKFFGIYPDDFPGITWKAIVKPGDSVKIGTPLLSDKNNPDLFIVSPVSGKVTDICRGERRHIKYISIEGSVETKEIKLIDERVKTKESIISTLLKSGLWAFIRQRPFDIIPDPLITPRDIFITAFDSAPLAPTILKPENKALINAGVSALSLLTEGNIYIGFPQGKSFEVDGAESIEFDGPHPAGNIGVQIAAVKPVNKGETVWALDIRTCEKIGKLCSEGILDTTAYVAVTGSEITNPHIIETIEGAQIKTLIEDNLKNKNNIRIISGNVLTGIKEDIDGYLHFPYRQITVIPEGDNADEFMGWASVNPKKYSVKHSFPAFLRGLSKPFHFDARIKGGHRAMILSGEYDKVFPFDIYPEYLIKAILANDIDRMEKLGIYEVAPEDFALPEFVDTSKLELQKIVKEGLDNLRKEL